MTSPAGDRGGRLAPLLRIELALHPGLAAVDVQKLVFQAVFGLHWRDEPITLARRLAAEWSDLAAGAGTGLPPLQLIDPEGRTARLHLAALKARGLPLPAIERLLVEQRPKAGAWARYDGLWREAIVAAGAGVVPIQPQALVALGRPAAPPRHSAGYGPAAYRVLNDMSDPKSRAWLRLWLGRGAGAP